MNTDNRKIEIEMAINEKREIMIQSARIYGFTNDITLRHSQELDLLINEYQRFFCKPEKRKVSFYKQKFMKVFEPSTIYV